MSDRFNCLKPESKNVFRNNRFKSEDKKVNSRWQRSKSPERKFNSFTSRGNGGGRGRARGRGRNFRDNKRYGPSKKFHNIQKDEKGRPMMLGATNNSFNPFDIAMKTKNKKEPKKNVIEKPMENIVKKNVGFEQTKMSDAEKQMILNMQYETDSEEDEEISEGDDN
tara:strand:+ start:7531 stop:8028 length:498 start_codon:yes stop_codon:yes gene_type:complete